MGDKSRTRSYLQKQVEQILKRTGGEDSNFMHALTFHLEILRDSKTEDQIESKEQVYQYILSKMFLDKMDLYPTQPFECRADENSEWPLKPIPSEFFGEEKQEDSERKMWFYESLKVGDLLDCRVSAVLPNSYQFRIIHKYGITRVLDDLHLMVVLQRARNEIQILERELLVCELVRVAVSKIDKASDEVTVHVTVDSENITSFRPIPRLGRITVKDVPDYVLKPPDTEKFPSYSDYLNSKPQFQNPYFYNGLFDALGINSKIVCSYFPEFNRNDCNENQTGQALLKESKLEDVKRLAQSAIKFKERKQYDESLEMIAEAMKICPDKDTVMSELYYIRSQVNSEQANSDIILKCLLDLELAFKLKPEDSKVKDIFLHKVFKVSVAHYIDKQYEKAVRGFELVLKHTNKNQHRAARILGHIKTKYADQLLNLEEKSLIDLQETKRELLSKLKNIDS